MERIKSTRELFAQIVGLIAKRGSCKRLQVGCVIVRDKQIISSGCNGPIDDNVETDLQGVCKCDASKICEEAVHAEQNAILFAARNGVALQGASMYCTHSPCMRCARAIKQSGIIKVVYLEEFRTIEPLTYLKDNGVATIKHS